MELAFFKIFKLRLLLECPKIDFAKRKLRPDLLRLAQTSSRNTARAVIFTRGSPDSHARMESIFLANEQLFVISANCLFDQKQSVW